MRAIKFRMDVLRGGVLFSKLDYARPPTIYMSYDSNIKMTLRGQFLRNEKVDYINDELRPVMIVDGLEHPLGVYKIVTKSESNTNAYQAYVDIEAYDRAMLLRWAKLERRDFWPAGTSYDAIISNYMTKAGIKNVSFVPSGHVLQSDREDWDIGTEYLTIINALLAEINYENIWFDVRGVAQVRAYVAPSANVINHTYGTSSGLKVLFPESKSEIDLYSQPNVFIAILDNPEYETPLVKYAENNTPSSKMSTVSRGIRIPAVYKVWNIASEDELQEYVNKIRNESMQMSEFVQVETVAMPDHNVGDVIALTHPNVQGIFREVEWTLSMDPGQKMLHRLQRVVIM